MSNKIEELREKISKITDRIQTLKAVKSGMIEDKIWRMSNDIDYSDLDDLIEEADEKIESFTEEKILLKCRLESLEDEDEEDW